MILIDLAMTTDDDRRAGNHALVTTMISCGKCIIDHDPDCMRSPTGVGGGSLRGGGAWRPWWRCVVAVRDGFGATVCWSGGKWVERASKRKTRDATEGNR